MVVKNGPNEDGYFYLDGVKQRAYQIVEFEGDYYYIGDYNKYLVNQRVFITESMLEGTTFTAGYYTFGPDGKMILN